MQKTQQIIFEKAKYKGKDKTAIESDIRGKGFVPLLITNTAGYTYDPHVHPQEKLIVIFAGSLQVSVLPQVYHCHEGDLIIIPGDIVHSALVGKHGCQFYWAEKLYDEGF